MISHDLLILRHGQTTWNTKRRIQGILDSPLTDVGQGQALAQRDVLNAHGFTHWPVLCSPMGRTLATASIVLDRDKSQIATDPRLMEIDVGPWAGAIKTDIEAQLQQKGCDITTPLALYHHSPKESLQDLHQRCVSLLHSLQGPTILITHGITSRMIRAVALGRPMADFAHVPGGQGIVHGIVGQRHMTFASGQTPQPFEFA